MNTEQERATIEAHRNRNRGGGQVRQYYYKVSGCQAEQITHANCICWHDKGTGVFKDMAEDDRPHGVKLTWRDKPQPTPSVASALHNLDSGAQNVDQAPQITELNINYKQLYEQMCDRCGYLDEELAKYTERPATPAIKESLTVAEPVRGPSDSEIFELSDDFSGMTFEDLDVVGFARALLARYGQPAQPAVSALPVTEQEEEAWQQMEKKR